MRVIAIALAFFLWGQAAMAAPAASLVQAAGLRAMDEPRPAAEFELSTPDGQVLRLQDLRGKVVLLNFWATWCPPCVQEMPLLDQLYQSLRQQPFVVWAVALKEGRDKVAPFMDTHRLQFPALLDTDGAVSTRYGVRGLPMTSLIDCNGNVVAQALGSREWTGEAIRTLLTALLSEPGCR